MWSRYGIRVSTMGLAVLIFTMGHLPGERSVPQAYAQESSCGNSIIEPGEQCDPPGGTQCPDPAVPGNFLPCQEDCTCRTPTPTNTPTATPTNTPIPNGGSCANGQACASGFCVDLLCCDTACTAPGEQCNLAGQRGTCASTAAPAPALTPWGLLVAAVFLVSVAGFALRHRTRSR